ncbi:penicillin-binding transpeptidase domain-containing protein [Streptomyces griseofuscus]|uniref:penicillin-binding transpeptidase domain-containing protein n=1 Tax=Streptomyces griseofuscus TaxID=146922 RepID=UPI0038277A42
MRINRRPATALILSATLMAGAAACDGHKDTPASDEVSETAHAFLSTWQSGDLDKAARLTTNPGRARSELASFRDDTGVASLSLTPERASGDSVPFKATARLSYSGSKATWKYTSKLHVINDAAGHARVSWHSYVINPHLPDGGGYTLQPFAESAMPVTTDRHGQRLTINDHPGLSQILAQLQSRYADTGQEALGIRLSSAGDSGDGHIVARLSPGKKAQVATRLDAGMQQAVDTATAKHPGASVVVIRPSTGDVLAARTTGTDFDPTLEGVQAPGQIFELVTSAALLDHGTVTTDTPVGCPASTAYSGQIFTNPGHWSSQDAQFIDVFTHTCDTAYVRLAGKLTGQDLASEAHDVFGLGLDWHTGLTTADGAVPELDGGDKAAAVIGRGEVRLNTLNLASLTATIQSGCFRQPLFVDPKISGKEPARTSHVLPGHVADGLRTLMRAYANASGVKGAAFGGVADQFTDSDQPIMGWFTAYHGDLAIAATVPETSHRPQTAKAVVRAVLDATT